MTRPFSLILGPDDIEAILDALRSSKGDSPASNYEVALAGRIERQWDAEKRARAGQEEAAAELAKLRESRAANHVLTPRQAMALAAIRAGKSAWDVWENWMGTPCWRRSRSMGGAVGRMVETLIEEGLLTDRRYLTDAGRARLDAWEAKHGKIGEAV